MFTPTRAQLFTPTLIILQTYYCYRLITVKTVSAPSKGGKEMQGGIIIMMKGLWYKVPSELFNDNYITKADMAVFAYVADRVKGKTLAVSLRSIQNATELSRRQVQKSLQKLCECRYLSAQERPGESTLYTQLLIPIKESSGAGAEPEREIYSTRGKEVI